MKPEFQTTVTGTAALPTWKTSVIGTPVFQPVVNPSFQNPKHAWAVDWLNARTWRLEAWAVYALHPMYKGRHDGNHKIPQRVRRFAECVWSDLQNGLITSNTLVL